MSEDEGSKFVEFPSGSQIYNHKDYTNVKIKDGDGAIVVGMSPDGSKLHVIAQFGPDGVPNEPEDRTRQQQAVLNILSIITAENTHSGVLRTDTEGDSELVVAPSDADGAVKH